MGLSSTVDARIKMSNLSEIFVEDPSAAFPLGKLVKGHIVGISGEKCALPPRLLHETIDFGLGVYHTYSRCMTSSGYANRPIICLMLPDFEFDRREHESRAACGQTATALVRRTTIGT